MGALDYRSKWVRMSLTFRRSERKVNGAFYGFLRNVQMDLHSTGI